MTFMLQVQPFESFRIYSEIIRLYRTRDTLWHLKNLNIISYFLHACYKRQSTCTHRVTA